LIIRLTTFSTAVSGLPIIILTTTGARLVVIASNFGQGHHPAWYHHLCGHPWINVNVDGVSRAYESIEVTGAEWERYYQRAVDLNLGWMQYRTRVRGRHVPVIRLDPVPPAE
jgi:deazaflavin-dependent oxidoreductase (nitroreductase family)